MEYFGYKKAGEAIDKSFIDWAGVTKTISDEIRGTLDKRQEQRNQLEKDHLDRLKKLNEFEAGVDPSLNTHLLRGAQQYRDYLLANHKQMKAGLISVDDAKIKNQNAMDGFTFYKQTIDSLGENVAALAEAEGKGNEAVAQEIAQIMNFGRNSIVPDMNTGEPYLVPKNEDGSLNMDAARPLRALPNIVGQKFAFVDVESTTDKIANSAGTWKQTFASGASIEDARQNPNYQKWIDNTITSNLNNDEKLASVLMDYLGMDYTTGDEEGKIKVSFDRSTGRLKPQLTDAQRKQARDAFQESIEAKIGAVRVAEQKQKPTAEERKSAITVDLINDFVSTGDFSNLANVLTSEGYTGANMSGDVLSITLPSGAKRSAKIPKGTSGNQVGERIASMLGLQEYKKVTGDREIIASESVFDIGTYKPITTGGDEAAPKVDRSALNNLSRALAVDAEMNEKVNPIEVLQYSQLIAKSLNVNENLIMIDPTGTVLIDGVSAGNINDGTATSANILSGIEAASNKSGKDDWTGIDPKKFNIRS